MMDFDKLIRDLQKGPLSISGFSRALDRTFKNPERTLTIIKPDAVRKGLIGEIITRLEEKGYKPVGMKMVKINALQARWFYHHLDGAVPKSVFTSLVQYMTSNRVVVVVWEGRGVVRMVRKLCGPTDPAQAKRRQIRALSSDDMVREFQHGRAVKNIIHASASVEDAQKEIRFFFLPWEILTR
jgi:nucleoside-diphosphate kinase